MPRYEEPLWSVLREAGQFMTNQKKIPFTRQDLIAYARNKYPEMKVSSLNPMIQGMTVNLKGGAPGGLDKNVFFSVGEGLFELYDPQNHKNICN